MAGQTLNLTIASQLQDAGFKDAASGLQGMDQNLKKTADSSGSLGSALGFIKELIPTMGLAEFLKEANTKALEAQDAQLRLKSAVEASGVSWDKNGQQLLSYTQALSENSRFTRTELTTSLADLVTHTHDVAMSQKDLQVAMGLSVATGRDLASVTDMIGQAVSGQSTFGLRELTRQFKLSGAAMHDTGAAMKQLSAIASQALNEDMNTDVEKQAKSWNQVEDSIEDVGKVFLPVADYIVHRVAVIVALVAKSVQGWEMLINVMMKIPFVGAAIKGLVGGISSLYKAEDNLAGVGDKTAMVFKTLGGPLAQAAVTNTDELAKAIEDLHKKTAALSNKGLLDPQQKIKQEVKDIIAEMAKLPGAQQHMEQIRSAAAAYGAAERAQLAQAETKKVEDALSAMAKKNDALMGKGLLDPKDREKAEIQRLIKEFEKLKPSAVELQTYISEVQQNADLQRTAEQQKALKAQIKDYEKYGMQVSNVVQQTLEGDKNAYKKAFASILQMLINRAQASIMIYFSEGAANEVAQNGIAGLAMGAALMAAGIASSAAVGALGTAAIGAIEGGGSAGGGAGSSSTAVGGTASGTVSGGAAVGTAPAQQGVTVYVTGDVYTDDAYINNLTRRISDGVQSRNLTLQASSAPA